MATETFRYPRRAARPLQGRVVRAVPRAGRRAQARRPAALMETFRYKRGVRALAAFGTVVCTLMLLFFVFMARSARASGAKDWMLILPVCLFPLLVAWYWIVLWKRSDRVLTVDDAGIRVTHPRAAPRSVAWAEIAEVRARDNLQALQLRDAQGMPLLWLDYNWLANFERLRALVLERVQGRGAGGPQRRFRLGMEMQLAVPIVIAAFGILAVMSASRGDWTRAVIVAGIAVGGAASYYARTALRLNLDDDEIVLHHLFHIQRVRYVDLANVQIAGSVVFLARTGRRRGR